MYTPRNLRKSNRDKKQTPGKQKGLNCQATVLEKYMAKRNRSYKDPKYGRWLQIKNGTHIVSALN